MPESKSVLAKATRSLAETFRKTLATAEPSPFLSNANARGSTPNELGLPEWDLLLAELIIDGAFAYEVFRPPVGVPLISEASSWLRAMSGTLRRVFAVSLSRSIEAKLRADSSEAELQSIALLSLYGATLTVPDVPLLTAIVKSKKFSKMIRVAALQALSNFPDHTSVDFWRSISYAELPEAVPAAIAALSSLSPVDALSVMEQMPGKTSGIEIEYPLRLLLKRILSTSPALGHLAAFMVRAPPWIVRLLREVAVSEGVELDRVVAESQGDVHKGKCEEEILAQVKVIVSGRLSSSRLSKEIGSSSEIQKVLVEMIRRQGALRTWPLSHASRMLTLIERWPDEALIGLLAADLRTLLSELEEGGLISRRKLSLCSRIMRSLRTLAWLTSSPGYARISSELNLLELMRHSFFSALRQPVLAKEALGFLLRFRCDREERVRLLRHVVVKGYLGVQECRDIACELLDATTVRELLRSAIGVDRSSTADALSPDGIAFGAALYKLDHQMLLDNRGKFSDVEILLMQDAAVPKKESQFFEGLTSQFDGDGTERDFSAGN